MANPIPFSVEPGSLTIRSLAPDDLVASKTVIDANQLFPADMLDEMTAPFLDGSAGEDRWLTVVDGQPIAIAYYAPERMSDGTWNLLLIAVHPDRHGQGIGSALHHHIERELTRRCQRLVLVETSGLPAFERTRGFYKMLGYDEEARIREYYRACEDKVVFRKKLSAGHPTRAG